MVQTTTLDVFLKAEGWPRIDLVKIDAEGAEPFVLEGMRELIQRPGPIKIIMEFNPGLLRNAGADPAQFLNFPSSLGLVAHIIEEKKGLTPLDGVDRTALVKDLVKNNFSLNLFCTRE